MCDAIKGTFHLVGGGYQYDGQVISDVRIEEIKACAQQIIEEKIQNVVVSGIFSPVRTGQEEKAYNIIKEMNKSLSVTMSCDIGGLGLLERENAAILNECLKPLCLKTIGGFREALTRIGLKCPFFLTQNDGTVTSESNALKFPVHSIASGPTNSMRGAAYLSRHKSGIVVDIGGTTTDIGVLVNGFPREAACHIEVGGVRTNFIMPDVFSFALGGGSYVESVGSREINVGPLSAGYLFKNEALVFGTGNYAEDGHRCITATDIAVSCGYADVGNRREVQNLEKCFVSEAVAKIHKMVTDAIDQVKTSKGDAPVMLVGGGSILIDPEANINGVSELISPKHFDVANAVGAALSQTAGCVDEVLEVTEYLNVDEMKKEIEGKDEKTTREIEKAFFVEARSKARKEKIQKAIDSAVKNGAIPGTVEIVEYQDIALAYLPGNATRMKIKAVGDMQYGVVNSCTINLQQVTALLEAMSIETETKKEKQTTTTAGKPLSPSMYTRKPVDYKPDINYTTGEWTLQEYDLQCISVGAGILGSGGGGNPHIGLLLSQKALREGKKIRVISGDRLKGKTNGFTAVAAFMGAPVITKEKLTSSTEMQRALSSLQDLYANGLCGQCAVPEHFSDLVRTDEDVTFIEDFSKFDVDESVEALSVVALMSAEIGGLNSMVPLYVGAEMNLPVVDCDGMGRAFPELQMFGPFIYGHDFAPACLANETGRTCGLLKADCVKSVEKHFRIQCVKMGCSASVTFCPISCEKLQDYTIPYSMSRAWRLGDAILEARAGNSSLLETIFKLEAGKVLIVGKIIEVNREVSGGFSKGDLTVEGVGTYRGSSLVIFLQNENLVAKRPDLSTDNNGGVVACTPDLICIVESNTGDPVPTEEVRYGLRVTVLALACPELMTTERALEVVGPSAFNYTDFKYIPIAKYVHPNPIPP